ncbi:MAG: hypothetical protein EOP86_15105 [Verrucomicrobiaceae bacterium]|nr:MAG: hypothetical protein EOP86_15105 [Verrucomicrobiaceae bacterium]
METLIYFAAFCGLCLIVVICVSLSTDDRRHGARENVSISMAVDCPIVLPLGADDICYAYDLYWQGGCMVARYHLPKGDLKKQAGIYLRQPVPWNEISAEKPANVPGHSFGALGWFQPSTITQGFESDSSGILWEPKVWIDEERRLIYMVNQN